VFVDDPVSEKPAADPVEETAEPVAVLLQLPINVTALPMGIASS